MVLNTKNQLAKRLALLLLFVAVGTLLFIKPPARELCKYIYEKPGIVVYFKYDYRTDGLTKFKYDQGVLKSKLDAAMIEYKIQEGAFSLQGESNHYYYEAYTVIETKDKEIDKVVTFLDNNSYQHNSPITLKTTRCKYPNLGPMYMNLDPAKNEPSVIFIN